MSSFLKKFCKDEGAAVTVDWVVLTAVTVGLGVSVYATMDTEVGQLASDISATIQDWDVTGATVSASQGTSGG
ncbi:MAG: hypothetical protein VX444_00805 [Pseudomonadota bacterium]|nr:hypothetical protein [Pseudomonadota bacterium]